MKNVVDTLRERGIIDNFTHEKELTELLGKEKVTFYIGFDPTADSLTIGSYLQVMTLAHMQRAGHRPIALMGGGTGFVGDPTGRTELRKMMSPEEIQHNVNCFKAQIERFIDFDNGRALILDNGDWLRKLNYIEFIRDYGVHFSVNRMLTADSYRTRFEKGLSFFEFNYMIMQSYDFLHLFREHNCVLQMGGSDQWSNILGGVELIRRIEGKEAFGLTTKLLTLPSGQKMGKSAGGAIWLDKEKTSPYDFYQYFRNVDDSDVIIMLKQFTFMELDEINEMAGWKGSELNKAKEILAYSVTKQVHGEEEAENAKKAAKALFSGGADGGSIPETTLLKAEIENGINLPDLMVKCKLVASKSEARRLIQENAVSVNSVKITSVEHVVGLNDFTDNTCMIQKGKKVFHRVRIAQ